MRGAGSALGARQGTELLLTKAEPTRSNTCAVPFPEGTAREPCPLRLGGGRDGIRHCRVVPGGRRGWGKHLQQGPRGSEGYTGEKQKGHLLENIPKGTRRLSLAGVGGQPVQAAAHRAARCRGSCPGRLPPSPASAPRASIPSLHLPKNHFCIGAVPRHRWVRSLSPRLLSVPAALPRQVVLRAVLGAALQRMQILLPAAFLPPCAGDASFSPAWCWAAAGKPPGTAAECAGEPSGLQAACRGSAATSRDGGEV